MLLLSKQGLLRYSNWTGLACPNKNVTASAWAGITCSSGHVTAVILDNKQLSGRLPVSLANLTYLQTLSFDHNSFTGGLQGLDAS